MTFRLMISFLIPKARRCTCRGRCPSAIMGELARLVSRLPRRPTPGSTLQVPGYLAGRRRVRSDLQYDKVSVRWRRLHQCVHSCQVRVQFILGEQRQQSLHSYYGVRVNVATCRHPFSSRGPPLRSWLSFDVAWRSHV